MSANGRNCSRAHEGVVNQPCAFPAPTEGSLPSGSREKQRKQLHLKNSKYKMLFGPGMKTILS